MGFLQSLECLCVVAGSGTINAQGTVVKATATCDPATLRSKIVAVASIISPTTRPRSVSASVNGVAKISALLSADANVSAKTEGVGSISPKLTVNYSLRRKVESVVNLNPKFLDKFAGRFDDLECKQKLYPIADIYNGGNGSGIFVGANIQSGNLFSFIDEGIFTGDYDLPFGNQQLVSDDDSSYIQPSSIATNASFSVKFAVTKPVVVPRDTAIRFRAAAPLRNYESVSPPQYNINNIKFEDPSGNLIAWYNDIVFRGDADLYAASPKNYTTYSSFPKVNNAALYEWQSGFPLLRDNGAYTLSFNVDVEGLDDPFDQGYNVGFAEDMLIAPSAYIYYPLPTKNLRISAIEICASGGLGPAPENYIPIYTEVEATGRRIERRIFPAFMPVFDYNTGIYPSGVETRWELNSDTSYKNTSALGSVKLIETLNQNPERVMDYIKLNTTKPINDSGKLLLKFSHNPVGIVDEITKGAFHCGFDESICGMWITPSGAFNTLNKDPFETTDHFFVVDTVSLRVLAKKAPGSRNYALDVVGYSDDKILNVTSAVGGFLQNIEGVGDIYSPQSSGFNPVDDLGFNGEPFFDRDQYFEASGTNNAGGDHYLLATRPVVSSTEWRWYEVPLKIYEDTVALGASPDYRMSSRFENLFLDIFPLPTGAAIAKIELLVRYAPQNALMMATQGGEMIAAIQKGRSEGSLYPVARQSNDQSINNAGITTTVQLSRIENIPHGFATPSSIKSNYSRRWRGMEGTVQGAFDVDMFDFGYNNPLLDFPFISGYYDFDYDVGNIAVPRVGPISGTISSPYSPYRYKNLGWRFTSGTLFANHLPGYSGNYLTTDWTSLSSGASNFQSNPLYGRIADAFNNVVRLSGTAAHNIDFGKHDLSNGFGVFLRFSPDANYGNLFNSGVLVSKWDAGSELEFALGYSGGYLRGIARSAGGAIHTVQDTTLYTQYQYPLNVILTYNDQGSSGLKLYTDHEIANNWTTIRASSVTPFQIHSDSSNLRVGYSSGSGIGSNIFVAEFGFSSGNIVYSNPDATVKEVTAQKFLENSRMKWWRSNDTYADDSYKLWSYVDENTYTDWKIGDFKYCMFAPAFDQMQKRTGRDLISFNIAHDGLAYSQRVNMPMPSSVSSGVAYHTQIENDFLRLHLSDTADNFYSASKRISKALPRGYKFADKALVVETVLEHETNSEIVWPEGQVGPKLIVSLYTKRQEPYWVPDENNWGLINRSIHYIEPSSCFMRVDSTFTYDSLVDESEQWALFPREPRLKEFEEKYFSQDVDDMFLQYDLVYPSGPAFRSRINVHSAHVRLEDAFVLATENNDALNVTTSGGYPVQEYVNLMLEARTFASGEIFNLYTVGPLLVQNSGMPLYTSGALIAPAFLSSYIEGKGGVLENINLYTSGSPSVPIYSTSGALNLHLFGKGIATSQAGNNLGLSLTSYNNQVANIPDPNVVNLFTFGSSGVIGAAMLNMPIFLFNNIPSTIANDNSGVLNLRTFGSQALFSRYPNGSLNLVAFNEETASINRSVNLTLYNDVDPIDSSGALNLFLGGQKFIWYNKNYGKDIDVADNQYASVPADDEIRGVELIGYGACDGDSPKKAIDPPIVTHDTVWREATCYDGGIFRAINTYTNLEAGYSGNYYGIRKFDGLVPNAKYNVEMKVTTGSTDPIALPRKWEEWEYGRNETINFSGVKLIADVPYVESGRLASDKYGSKVVVKKDLIAVGSPFHEIPDESGYPINNAGAVFLYRRNEDLAGLKAGWQFEDVLMLPSGYRRDYVSYLFEDYFCYNQFCIDAKKWSVGQEGREFGSAISIANSGEREVVVVGAPGASWSRQFPEIITSGIPVCMVVLTDEFPLDRQQYEAQTSNVAGRVNYWDVLYKYFSAPWSGGFTPDLNAKILVCQLVQDGRPTPPVVDTSADKILYHTYLNSADTGEQMLGKLVTIFHSGFPIQNGPHSGIPPIVGIFEDQSWSTTFGAAFKGLKDSFKNYYRPFAYQSGVVDTYGVKGSGYVNIIGGASESWDKSAIQLLDATLATGNLISTNNLRYITSGVGQEWANENAAEFQIPPFSGGRVYVFEKEFGQFNLIQEIKPFGSKDPNSGGGDDTVGTKKDFISDRFGHAVSISENGEVVSIGSPFIREPYNQCEVYERDDSEYQRMLDGIRGWFDYYEFTEKLEQYDFLVIASGADIAKQNAYQTLNKTEKFALRHDYNYWLGRGGIIKQYTNVFNYNNKQINYLGSWYNPTDPNTPVQKWCGTSRLGYSTAVDNDGYNIAFGAPTDSFNEFDDTDMWYENGNSWASYTYAGAVRMFQARQYYNHNLVVEYYKFGNLDRNAHPDLIPLGYYDRMGQIFGVESSEDFGAGSWTPKPFRRTDFSELEIPKEAGLAFIITPEIDAASDEIIQNIKDWLSLGNRTLVLVGNDPVYEENGLYSESNKIINKILAKLNSRMRITAARNEYESLPQCISNEEVENRKYNVTRAFQPIAGHPTYIGQYNLFAKGVGDIKIDLSSLSPSVYQSFANPATAIYAPCDAFLPVSESAKTYKYCEMPLINSGDLRAQWFETCFDEGSKAIKYAVNWPQQFASDKIESINALKCKDYPNIGQFPRIDKPYEDPKPILTAGEWVLPSSYLLPRTSGKVYRLVERTEIFEAGTIYKIFDENHTTSTAFNVLEDQDSEPSGIFEFIDYGDFIDPDTVAGIDALLQATGIPLTTSIESDRLVSNGSVLMLEENYPNGTPTAMDDSKVIIIASLLLESEENLTGQSANGALNYNIPFYGNIVAKNGASLCSEPSIIHQLGGWTKRTSFTDAYPNSNIKYRIFSNSPDPGFKHSLVENKIYGSDESISADVVWIANPNGFAQNSDINRIKSWLATGGKKLVITYCNDQNIANYVKNFCERVGIQSAPWFSESQGEFLKIGLGENILPAELNLNHPFVQGCPEGYKWIPINNPTNIVDLQSYEDSVTSEAYPFHGFIPIKPAGDHVKIININSELYETYLDNADVWQMNAVSTIQFETEAGSGYRMFIDYVSQTPFDREYLVAYANEASIDPNADMGTRQILYKEERFKLTNTPVGSVERIEFDFKAFDDITNIELVSGPYTVSGVLFSPKTVRIVSVSGNLLPINEIIIDETTSVTRREWIEEWVLDPPITVFYPGGFRPIMTDSAKYCASGSSEEYWKTNCPGKLIEDGPVVVAEEYENFSSFTSGSERSRIVLITDSTILQGQCPQYREDKPFSTNQKFIRNLYPPQPVVPQGNSNSSAASKASRKWEFTQKIVAPERGSPGKFFHFGGGKDGLINLFGGGSAEIVIEGSGYDGDGIAEGAGAGLYPEDFTSDENNYDPADLIRPVLEEGDVANGVQLFKQNQIAKYRLQPRLITEIDSQLYYDVNVDNNPFSDQEVPLVEAFGKDFLDFDFVPSGFRGDLFGYSVDIHNGKLVVGTPFNGYTRYDNQPVNWSGVIYKTPIVSGDMTLSANGGAGAVFYYEKTGKGTNFISSTLPWQFKQKIKPDSINVGVDNPSVNDLLDIMGTGVQNLDSDFVFYNAEIGDQFGYAVAIDADFVAVGAPGHDFETVHEHIYSGSAAFIRKEFTYGFDIPLHNFYDMGSSGVRIDQYNNASGVAVLNNGAVFTFEHRIKDWRTREKKWEFAEKLVAQGYNTRNQVNPTGCENDFFGRSVSIDRARRGDGDYTMIVGSPNHNYPTSGAHITGTLEDAGAAYIYDAMLREQEPKIPSSGGWIKATTFGYKPSGTSDITLMVYQNTSGSPISYQTSGLAWATNKGTIYLEASGYDAAGIGFVAHRPYVEWIIGELIERPPSGNIPLYIDGSTAIANNMNLYLSAEDSAFVYNNMNLYTKSWNIEQIGSGNTPLSLVSMGNVGVSGGLNLYVDSWYQNQNLNLFMRGI